MIKEKLTQEEKILADVDDEIFLMKQRMKLKHRITMKKAHELVNKSLRSLMCSN